MDSGGRRRSGRADARPRSRGGAPARRPERGRERGEPAQPESVFLTTQPGWAVATLAELRAAGMRERVELLHRDSTVLAPAGALPEGRLQTVAEAYGALAVGWPRGEADATRALAGRLARLDLKAEVLRWLAGAGGAPGPRGARGTGQQRTWSAVAEAWGETQVQRRQLREMLAGGMRAAFPRWREGPMGGVRLLVKADTRAAVAGVQLYSSLEGAEGSREGALREHLACGLLVLAGVPPPDARAGVPYVGTPARLSVVDPFMGSGTILEAAVRRYGAEQVVGAEVEGEGFRQARERLRGLPAEARVRRTTFEALETEEIPEGACLVSNLPFGVQFQQVETGRLVRWLGRVAPRLGGVALLLAREQAVAVADRVPLGLRVKNVLVLGQPAAIAYRTLLRM